MMTCNIGYNFRAAKMNYKLLLIASLLFVATIVKAEEEEIPSEIDEMTDELKEVVPDDENENEIVVRDESEQMKQQVRFMLL